MDKAYQNALKIYQGRVRLFNPPPRPPHKDMFRIGLSYAAVICTLILSVSRTGLALARIGALPQLGTYFGLVSVTAQNRLAAVESLLGLMFELVFFLVGVLIGHSRVKVEQVEVEGEDGETEIVSEVKVSVKWWYLLLALAIIPATFAAVYPGLESANEIVDSAGFLTFTRVFLVVTNIFIGFCVPPIANVLGIVIGMETERFDRIREFQLDTYEAQLREMGTLQAFHRSPEFKAYKAGKDPAQAFVSDAPKKGRPTVPVNLKDEIVSMVTGNEVKLATLDKAFSGVSMAQIIKAVLELQAEGRVKLVDDTVTEMRGLAKHF
jgi:hypothetical protein